MSTIKSSSANLTLNADGSGNDIKFQSNAVEVGSLTAEGVLTIGGTTPTLTIGDAGAEDTKIVFDGNAQDYYIGLDDTDDDFKIGLGSTLGTTAHIVIDETGAVTKPLQPAFQATMSASQSNIAASTETTILFNTEIFDVNSDFNTGTYTFTAPVTGKYLLTLSTRLQDIANDSTYIWTGIVTSNRDYKHIFDPTAYNATEAYLTPTISVVADMDASDTAFGRIFASSSGAILDISNSANYSVFTGCLLC